jgi:hypothetical protein
MQMPNCCRSTGNGNPSLKLDSPPQGCAEQPNGLAQPDVYFGHPGHRLGAVAASNRSGASALATRAHDRNPPAASRLPTVQYLDVRDNRLHAAKVIEFKPDQLMVHASHDGKYKWIRYAAIGLDPSVKVAQQPKEAICNLLFHRQP